MFAVEAVVVLPAGVELGSVGRDQAVIRVTNYHEGEVLRNAPLSFLKVNVRQIRQAELEPSFKTVKTVNKLFPCSNKKCLIWYFKMFFFNYCCTKNNFCFVRLIRIQ